MQLAYPGDFSWPERNTTVVTPSPLLASVAEQDFAMRQIEEGRQSWVRPPVMSVGAWLTRCWHEARYRSSEVPTLLSGNQEHMLWRSILEGEEARLFDLEATAQMASRAAREMAEAEILAEEGWPEGGDAARFKRWWKLFRRECQKRGWMTRADVWSHLPHWISQGWWGSGQVTFLLLKRPSAALTGVRNRLGERCRCEQLGGGLAGGPANGKAFDSVKEELNFAARWARDAFENSSAQSIGVLVADLKSRQARVEERLRDVFYSGACRALVESRLRTALDEGVVYNLVPEAALGTQPLIAGAMLLLQVAQTRVPVSEAGAILRSRWLAGAAAERSARALADLELRRLRELDVSLSDMERASQRCPRLKKTWAAARRMMERQPELNSFGKWSEFMGQLLSELGWPGEEDLSKSEQRALEAWKNALSQLASLALVSEPVSYGTAMGQMRRLVEAGFGREGGLLAPVQILDAADAGGLRFDTALMVGLGEDTWPPMRRSTPFIPLGVQRRHGMEGSSQEQSRAERETLTRALFGAAATVFATWAGRLAAVAEPLVKQVAETPQHWVGKTTWESYKAAILEEKEDDHGPPYDVQAAPRGGTGIIKSQSLCPFRAFAEYRLGSRAPEEGCLGFDSRDRGGHLHAVLESVWKKLRTSDRLRTVKHPELVELIVQAAQIAVPLDHPSSFGKVVSSVELERLKELALEWLDLERQRKQAFTVELVEGEQYIELAGMRLRLRLDRIDRLSHGGLLLIDYKSGEQKRKKLESPRPEEPQLLVYAAGIGREVEGVVFAQLKQRDVRAVGWTREKQFSTAKTRTVDELGHGWEARMSESRAEVERLARQFRSGYAAVDPLPGACEYCAQKPLCRISERSMEMQAERE